MKALRVLSVLNNNIDDVPYCVGYLDTLRVLKLGGNPLTHDLKRIVESTDGSPSRSAIDYEKDALLTKKVKSYLKAAAAAATSESGGESRQAFSKPLQVSIRQVIIRKLAVRVRLKPLALSKDLQAYASLLTQLLVAPNLLQILYLQDFRDYLTILVRTIGWLRVQMRLCKTLQCAVRGPPQYLLRMSGTGATARAFFRRLRLKTFAPNVWASCQEEILI